MCNNMAVITLDSYLDLIKYKITEGTDYNWQCYGSSAYILTRWDDRQYELNIIFDTVDRTVYQVDFHDYVKDKSYIWINHEFRQSFIDESNSRGLDAFNAYEDMNFIDLSSKTDELINIISNIVDSE